MSTSTQQSRLKELIAKGKEQGYLTYAQVNDHLPDDIANPDTETVKEDVTRSVKIKVAKMPPLGAASDKDE